MPRRQNTQNTASVVPPLNAEEVKFWLKIMEEHAVFIKDRLSNDQTELLAEARKFKQEFKNLRLKSEKIQNGKKFLELTGQISASLKEYIRYKRLLLCLALTGKLCSVYPLFIDHLVREAEYFMALLSKMRGKTIEVVNALETDFWLRTMSDHTHLLELFVDPAENGLKNVLKDYVDEFDALSREARIFTSMLYSQTTQFPVFERFLKDSRSAATRLRDFKKVFAEMISANKVITAASDLLADHARREADHFLLVIVMMEKGIVKNCKLSDTQSAKYAQYETCQSERETEFNQFAETQENNESDLLERDILEKSEDREEIKPLFSLSDHIETDKNNFFQQELYSDEKIKYEPELKRQPFFLLAEEEKAPKRKPCIKWPRRLGKVPGA